MSVCTLTVLIEMIFIEIIYYIHYLYSQLISHLTVTVSALYSLFFKKNVYSLGKSYKTEHGGESIPTYKALFCKEIVLKETTLLDLKLYSLIHISCHNIHNIRQSICLKVFDILRSLCDISQDHSCKCI